VAVRSRNVLLEYGFGKGYRVRLSVLAARVFSFFAYHTPVPIGYFLADLIAVWMFLRFHNYRRVVMSNLRNVYRGELPERELRKRARWVFRTSSRNFWDLASLPRMDRERLETMHYVEEGSWEIIDDAMAKGSGAILIGAHLGAFDFIGQYVLAGRHRPLVLAASTVPDYLFAGVMYWRSSLGVRLRLVGRQTLRDIVQAIRKGEFVTMVGDYNFGAKGYPVDFFGHPTTLPSGAVKLARETGAPLIPVLSFRKSIQHRTREFYFRIGPPIYIERTENRDYDIDVGMKTVVAVLEDNISRAPEQWVIFQRVWPE
jgi:lauroyl/myristoyl acyltransferase